MQRTLLATSALLLLAACNPPAMQNGESLSSSSTSSASPLQMESSSSVSSGMQELISVESPVANATIASPVTVTGSARGTWFFEATFPVRLLDADGTVLAESFAEAQDDWMTEDFVPFSASFSFTAPVTATGTMVLEKANPSGLPENSASVQIPVQF